MRFFLRGAIMQIYYVNLQAIEQRTMQLDLVRCPHCERTHQLVSHGYIYKKQGMGVELEAVGKRVFCSNRSDHTGCGRTVQLYMDATVRYLHHAGSAVVAFLLSLAAGTGIQRAYTDATGAATPRHAYRWLDRLCAQLSAYRSLSHRPLLREAAAGAGANRPVRLLSLIATAWPLLQRFGQPLCAAYQLQLQRPFL
jgi:hypothetical protein